LQSIELQFLIRDGTYVAVSLHILSTGTNSHEMGTLWLFIGQPMSKSVLFAKFLFKKHSDISIHKTIPICIMLVLPNTHKHIYGKRDLD
jgi:hypothetical protein